MPEVYDIAPGKFHELNKVIPFKTLLGFFSGGDDCFIATAAHGSTNVPLIVVLGLITAGFVGLLRARRVE